MIVCIDRELRSGPVFPQPDAHESSIDVQHPDFRCRGHNRAAGIFRRDYPQVRNVRLVKTANRDHQSKWRLEISGLQEIWKRPHELANPL